MNGAEPTLVSTGTTGPLIHLHRAIDEKFRESHQRKFLNSGVQLVGKTTTYGAGEIIYGGADIFINIDGENYNLGQASDIFELVSFLKILDIGWWDVYEDPNPLLPKLITVRGFHSFGDLTQDGAGVCSPDTDQNNDTVPTDTDLFRDIFLRLSRVGEKIGQLSWLQNGNEFLSTGTWFGTISDHDVPFRTFDIERMSLLKTGELMIGASATPLGTLHVKGASGQSPLYVVTNDLSDSFEFRSDGAIYRDGIIWSLKSGTDTVVGQGAGIAVVTQDHNAIFGYQAAVALTPGGGSGQNNVLIGANIAASMILGSDNTLIGYLANVASDPLDSSIALGTRASITASNQWVVGATSFPINDAYFGKGESTGTPSTFTLHGTNATGANVAAGNFQFAVGASRGAGAAGKFIFRNTKTGGGPSVAQSLYDTVTIDSTYISYSPHGTSAGNTFETRYLELSANGTDYIGWKGANQRTTNTFLILALPADDPLAGQTMIFGAPSGNVSQGTWATPSASGIVVGTTTITSGTTGAIPFNSAGIYQEDATMLFWDDSNNLLGVGKGASLLGRIHSKAPALGYALYTEFSSSATQNWSISDTGELRYASGRGAFIDASTPSSTYFGFNAGINMSDGNTAFGALALGATGAGGENVAMGGLAGNKVTSGDGNLFFGYNSGNTFTTPDGANRVGVTTGFNSVYIGQRSGAFANNISDSIAIGTYAMVRANNQLVIGGSADNAEYYGINDVYIGQGVSLEALNMGQASVNIQTTGITAGQTDISAAVSYLAWCSAVGTGTGIGGDVRFYSAPAGTTASTRNALFRQVDWRGDGFGINYYQKSTPLVPGASVTDGVVFYINDYAGAGTASPFFRTENGTVISLAALAAGGSQTPWTSNINADGFTLFGNDGASETLTLASTSHGTKGKILFGTSAYDEVNNRLGIGTVSPGSAIEIQTNALGVTQLTTAGLSLTNTTAAALGAQQISPAIRWTGQGWKTNATAASQGVEYRAYVLPVEGTTAPTGSWIMQGSINGGAYSNLLTLDSAGALFATASINSPVISAGTQLKATGNNNVSAATYRTTNGGSNATSFFFTGATTVTAGSLSVGYDTTNQLMFIAANGTRNIERAFIQIASLNNTAGSEAADLIFGTQTAGAAATERFRITALGGFAMNATNTPGGTTGDQTINKPSGTVNFATGTSTLTVTNSLVTTSSLVFPVVLTNDAAAIIKNVVRAAGSFTITLNAATGAETCVGFFVIN